VEKEEEGEVEIRGQGWKLMIGIGTERQGGVDIEMMGWESRVS
jgi:hypothetical protein